MWYNHVHPHSYNDGLASYEARNNTKTLGHSVTINITPDWAV
ncbi:hypothetical protein [Anaerocolumna aminovalerica]|nr:hypothetical protein [Anaerocolumna aminovalerica]